MTSCRVVSPSFNGSCLSFPQSLRSKRFAVFSETKLAVITLLEELEAEPDTTFERNVVCEDDDSFVLSASNLQALDEVHKKLERKIEENKITANDLRKTIFRLMDKLQQSELEKDRIERELCGHSPSTLSEVSCGWHSASYSHSNICVLFM